ncbi:MAG: hypothetical protein AAFW64_02160 [Pseudomonadota bacterium]
MMDDPDRSAKGKRNTDGSAVASLASQALSVLASRRLATDARFAETMVQRLEHAVLDRNPDRRMSVLAELRAAGISDVQIAEELIPLVAARLGDAWCEDNMSFVDVTIGSARLQAMVRDLGAPDPDPLDRKVGSVAVIVPQDETHTLGALVLTNRLRRQNILVRLFVGTRETDVLDVLARSRYDAVLMSVSHSEKLAQVERYLTRIRQVLPVQTPIIVGGSVVDRGILVEKHLTADYITSDVEAVLYKCGLNIRNFATQAKTPANADSPS